MSAPHIRSSRAQGLDLISGKARKSSSRIFGGSVIESLEQRRLYSVAVIGVVLTETGGSGDDTVSVDQNGSLVTMTENGTPYTYGTWQFTQIVVNSGGGQDLITVGSEVTIGCSLGGGNGNDTITGGGGNDSITGGLGNDSMDGGGGINTVTYANRVNALSITLNDEPGSGDPSLIELDIINNCQNVIGGYGNDYITGNAANNSLDGGGGYDTLLPMGGNDSLIDNNGGTAIADYQTFNNPNYTANIDPYCPAFQGSAFIYSSGNLIKQDNLGIGVPNVIGMSAGSDTIAATADTTPHLLVAMGGINSIMGGMGPDTLVGGAGSDTLCGKGGADYIIGGTGTNVLFGSQAGAISYVDVNNTILGGSGNDTIHAGNYGGDSIIAGGGTDSIRADNSHSDTILGGGGSAYLFADVSDVFSGMTYVHYY